MSVQKRRRGRRVRWIVRWKQDGLEHSRTFDLKDDAIRFDADARRRSQLGAHAPVEAAKEPLGAWLTRWWDREAPTWAASTRRQRGSVLDKWIVPYLSGVRLRDLGTGRVRDWLSEIGGKGCPASQVNQALRVLSAALGVAVRDGLLPSNPCTGLRKVPVQVSRPKALTPHEVELIAVNMPSLRDAAMVSLMAYAGLRPEELVALRWSDVGTNVIVIDRAFTDGELKGTKSGARRTIEIIEPLAEDLAAYRPHRADAEALVVPSQSGGFIDWSNWRYRYGGPPLSLRACTER